MGIIMKPVNNIEYSWVDAVLSLLPRAKVYPADTYSEATWHEEETRDKPTQAEVDAELTRLIALSASLEYRSARKAEYDLLNQFELMTDDAANGTTTHADAIAAIKLAHPKQ